MTLFKGAKLTYILDNKELENNLKRYLTGKLDYLIKKAKRKMNKKYSDDYYNTLSSGSLSSSIGSNTGHSDPTANRAVFIADMKRYNELDYQNYKTVKKAVLGALEPFDKADLILLQYKFRLKKGGYIKASKVAGLPQYKARKRQNELIEILNTYEWPLSEQYI